MNILIIGYKGFIGSNLTNFFKKLNYNVLGIDKKNLHNLNEFVKKSEVVINLAGATILKRWSKNYKKLIYSSRIETTKKIVESIKKSKKTKLFISTSAVGIYNHKKEKIFTEYDKDYGKDFLAKVCIDWEKEALKAKEAKIKVAIFRLGVVLGDGGALKQMLLPFKLGLGGKIGDGKQPFSYIHIKDLENSFAFIIKNQLEGIFNLTSPELITNKDFSSKLAKILNRPAFFTVPKFALKLIYGEGAQVLTTGVKAYPKNLLDRGFKFEYDNIEKVLKDLILKK